jgi:hypothetical protein
MAKNPSDIIDFIKKKALEEFVWVEASKKAGGRRDSS